MTIKVHYSYPQSEVEDTGKKVVKESRSVVYEDINVGEIEGIMRELHEDGYDLDIKVGLKLPKE